MITEQNMRDWYGTPPAATLTEYERRLVREVVKALEWALPYAERAHELAHPGETYERDGYVADSVRHARETLAKATGHD